MEGGRNVDHANEVEEIVEAVRKIAAMIPEEASRSDMAVIVMDLLDKQKRRAAKSFALTLFKNMRAQGMRIPVEADEMIVNWQWKEAL
jgi:hypothetical protein